MSVRRLVPFAVYLQDQSAAIEASTGGWIRRNYSNAIEYSTLSKGIRGVMFLVGGVGGALIAFFAVAQSLVGLVNDSIRSIDAMTSWFVWLVVVPLDLLFLVLGIWALRFFGRLEFFRPHDLPILFDRKRRKVYRLLEDLDDNGNPRQKGRSRVIEHDWDDIVAEHHVSTATTGSSAQRYHTLVLMVRDKNPGAFQGPITPTNLPPYVDGFGLGDAKVLSEYSVPRVWEHVRRYMNENGPALPPGERLADTTVPVTWWDSLGSVSVFGPGYFQRWRDSWGWMLIAHLFSPLLLPLALLMSITHWASYKTAYEVRWPAEVLERLGPPVQ